MGLFRTWFPPPTGSPLVAVNTLVRMSLLWSLDGLVGTQCLMNVSVTSELYSGPGDSYEGRQSPWREVAALPKRRRMNSSWLQLLQIFADITSGETLPSLKLQPFPILPIPFPCFIFLLSIYI